MATGLQIGLSLFLFSRPGGPGLLTTSRWNDFELYRPARRAGLGPLTTTQEGVAVNSGRLFYIDVAGSSLAGEPNSILNPNNKGTHEPPSL